MSDEDVRAFGALLRAVADRLDPPAPVHDPGDDESWESLPLDVRSFNSLKNAIVRGYRDAQSGLMHPPLQHIKTVGDLRGMTDWQLLRIKNLGRKSLQVVRQAITEHSVSGHHA